MAKNTTKPEDPAADPVASKDPAADPAAPEEPVECAVLMDSIYGRHDAIITLPAGEAKAAAADGYVDPHPNAIRAIRDRGH